MASGANSSMPKILALTLEEMNECFAQDPGEPPQDEGDLLQAHARKVLDYAVNAREYFSTNPGLHGELLWLDLTATFATKKFQITPDGRTSCVARHDSRQEYQDIPWTGFHLYEGNQKGDYGCRVSWSSSHD